MLQNSDGIYFSHGLGALTRRILKIYSFFSNYNSKLFALVQNTSQTINIDMPSKHSGAKRKRTTYKFALTIHKSGNNVYSSYDSQYTNFTLYQAQHKEKKTKIYNKPPMVTFSPSAGASSASA
jgi:hypothetical protein